MKIDYCLIQSPFQYGKSYLNINNYTPPDHKLVKLFGTIAKVMSKSTYEITLIVLLTVLEPEVLTILKFADNLNDRVINNNLYNFSFEQLCSTYQHHVLINDTYKSFLSHAMKETSGMKNNNGSYKDDASPTTF